MKKNFLSFLHITLPSLFSTALSSTMRALRTSRYSLTVLWERERSEPMEA